MAHSDRIVDISINSTRTLRSMTFFCAPSRILEDMSADLSSEVLTRIVRVKKAESAFVYAIFESNEGVLSYSTLDGDVHAGFRDLELTIPVSRKEEAMRMLEGLGDLIVTLKENL